MAETVYRKVGRKYVPVGIFDPQADYLPIGAHLLVVEPGVRSTRFNVNPACADLLAGLRACREPIMDAIRQSSITKSAGPLTPAEQRGYRAYCKAIGHEGMLRLSGPSAADICDALEAALIKACAIG